MRVYKNESLLHQRFLIIECHAVQVDKRFRIDKDAYVGELEDPVALARLRVEADVVAQAGASATLHPETQPTLLR